MFIMIIGLTGRIAAGKEVIVGILEEKGFVYMTISEIIRNEMLDRGLTVDRTAMQDFGNLLREQEGTNSWIKRLMKKMNSNDDYVIDGIRNPGEIDELRKMKDFILIAIDAPKEDRFQRMLKRRKPSDPKTWEEFLVIDERDFGEEDSKGQQVGKCMEMADYKIDNNSSYDDFIKKVSEILEKILTIENN